MQRRKQIDNFLIELDKYLEWLKEYEAMDLINIFHNKVPKINSFWRKTEDISLPNLEKFLNWIRQTPYNIWPDNQKWKRSPIKATWKSSKYIRRLAYSLDWKEIPEISYEHFFDKNIYYWVNARGLELEYNWKDYLSKNSTTKILIPTELFDSLDLCFFKKSIN